MVQREPLIVNTEFGLFCPSGGFYIDAWGGAGGVERNIVTHGHSDHARVGAKKYLTAREGVGILRRRLGEIDVMGVEYGEEMTLGETKVSLHPAGHVLGSAQVRVERGGEVWVFTGDYKTQADATCAGFELVRCDTFITECTFGLPVFRWPEEGKVVAEINSWWRGNVEAGRTSVMLAYALGKAQRVLSGLDESIGPILLHGAMVGMTEAYREMGVKLPAAEYASAELAKQFKGKALVIAPASAMNSVWARKFGAVSDGVASGWMQVRGFRRRQAADRGFVFSDHVDWAGLMGVIEATGARKVIATHGYTGPVVKYLREKGYEAEGFETRFKNEGEEEGENQEASSKNQEEGGET